MSYTNIESLLNKWKLEMNESYKKLHYKKKDKHKNKIRKKYIKELTKALNDDINESQKDSTDRFALKGVDANGEYTYYNIKDYNICKNCPKFYDNEDFCRYECWSKTCILK